MWKLLGTQAVVTLLALWVFPAQAVLMDYIFTGYTTGSFGGIPYSNALVTLNLYADTANIVTLQSGLATTLSLDGSSATVTVDGIGTGTFTTTKRVFVTTVSGSPQFSAVGFSRGGTSGYDMWDFDSSAFASYNLGPLATISGLNNSNGAGIDEPTTFGDFIDTFPTIVYPATFTAIAVPEPSAGPLFAASAVMGLIALRVTRIQKPSPFPPSQD